MHKILYRQYLHSVLLLLFISILSNTYLFSQSIQNRVNFDQKTEIIEKAVSIKPHPRQYEWQKKEFTAFIHFGVNTFTGREWGDGFEDPKIFNPANLDTDQWCEAIKSAGMKMVIFTAKHHDGFCLWQTRYTDHSVRSSEWLNGEGDVLKDLAASCKKFDLKLGVYLSPADLFQIENIDGLYGNGSSYSMKKIPRSVEGRPFKELRTFTYYADDYNEYFMNQLFELLTEYGPIHEVWFDGAHPKRKGGQKYTYNQWYELIRELAPQAVIFGKGPDVRWCGNEAGRTRESEWSVIPISGTLDNWTWPDMTDEDLGSLTKIKDCLDNGGFLHWYPAETNTSIRHGWFWRDEAQYVKTVNEILDIWYRSVGGNTVFLLNIPPNSKGLLSERDVDILRKVGSKLEKTFSKNLANASNISSSSFLNDKYKSEFILDGDLNSCWIPDEISNPPYFTVKLPEKREFNRIVLQEQIQDYSQRISKFMIEAEVDNNWQMIAEGTTVGYKKICRASTVHSDRIKVTILDSRLSPTINNFSLHFEEITISNPVVSRNKEGLVSIECNPPGPVIKYTLDGSRPNIESKLYTKPFKYQKQGIVKAVAFDSELKNSSEIVSKKFDVSKIKWKVLQVSSEQSDNGENGFKAIDGDENTNWITQWRPKSLEHPHFIALDLGEELNLIGFTYTPRKEIINGTIKSYKFFVSDDGEEWQLIIEDEFDNIKNNPVKQEVLFDLNIPARYIKLTALSEINDNPWASAAEIGVITQPMMNGIY